MEQAPIRLLLADDQSLFLSGLEALLTMTPEFQVVGAARRSEEAIAMACNRQVDVILLDIGLPDRSGIDTAIELRRLGVLCPILIVSNYDTKDHLLQAISAGVYGYLLKDADADTLRQAIREIYAGKRFIDSRLLALMMDALSESSHARPPALALPILPSAATYTLTPREVSVLQLMAAGYNNLEIAKSLYITPKTARNHTTNILQKLGVPDRTKAVVLALSKQLISS